MKRNLLVLLFSLFLINAQAQRSRFDIIGTPPDFNYSTISDYENPKVFNNAVRLNLGTITNGYRIYFRSDGPIKTNKGQSIPENKFGIRIHNTNPVIPLSATNDQLLVSSTNNDVQSYYLDFIIAPLYYDYDPGSYVINILFTLTSD